MMVESVTLHLTRDATLECLASFGRVVVLVDAGDIPDGGVRGRDII